MSSVRIRSSAFLDGATLTKASRRSTVLFLLALALALGALARTWTLAGDDNDFRTTYCTATAWLEHGNPYRIEPIRACEQRVSRNGDFRHDDFVMPGTVPPYALWAFVPFALLPYAWAAALYGLAIEAAALATIVLVRRLSALPVGLIALAIGGSDALAGALNGQLVPFSVLGVALAAWAVVEEAWWLAALGVTVAAIEPHLAAATWLALLAWRPPARLALAVAAAALVGISLLSVGFDNALAYVTQVVPAQAHAEIAYAGQYGLGTLLFDAGAHENVAAGASAVLSLAALAGGAFAGGVVARRLGAPAAVAAMPPAIALLGGYAHLPPFAFVVLAALVLLGAAPNRQLSGAVVLCGVPWGMLVNYAAGPAFAALLAGGLAWYFPRRSAPVPLLAAPAAAAAAAFAYTFALQLLPKSTAPRSPVPVLPDSAWAADQWSLIVHAMHDATPFWLLAKLPTWLGAVLFVVVVARVVRDPAAISR